MRRNKSKHNFCDLGRSGRTNVPEVVFARGKDDSALVDAASELLDANRKVLVTKCSKRQTALLKKEFGRKVAKCDHISGTVVISEVKENTERAGSAAIIAAGTSDYFVAEEAAITLEFFGFGVLRYYDCGVAGVHRLVSPIDEINKKKIDAVIVVAGMEGALPSLVSGLVKQPIVAVPTSVGYGTSFNGVTALLSMLNSCSPGIAVVNIDNGFGAAVYVHKMVRWLKTGK
jgi:hypothetical protein